MAAQPVNKDVSRPQWAEVVKSGQTFREQEGVLVPEQAPAVVGQNQKYQVFYNRFGWAYDLWEIAYAGLSHGGRDAARAQLLKDVTVKPGDRVLEVSVGTGVNIRYLSPAAACYGLDISWGMLRKCCRNRRRWKLPLTLFYGIAEDLPFRDGAFDVVFHIGGINFFQDPAKAVAEMIRVARPGAILVYGDETDKQVREIYAKTPLVGKYFQEQVGQTPSPLAWLPKGCAARYDVILKGNFYLVSFTK